MENTRCLFVESHHVRYTGLVQIRSQQARKMLDIIVKNVDARRHIFAMGRGLTHHHPYFIYLNDSFVFLQYAEYSNVYHPPT